MRFTLNCIFAALIPLICLTACSRETASPLNVVFKCTFEGVRDPPRIGLDLAREQGTFVWPPDVAVQFHAVAKGEELALLPGANEEAIPQVRIRRDGAATFKGKPTGSGPVTVYHGSCVAR